MLQDYALAVFDVDGTLLHQTATQLHYWPLLFAGLPQGRHCAKEINSRFSSGESTYEERLQQGADFFKKKEATIAYFIEKALLLTKRPGAQELHERLEAANLPIGYVSESLDVALTAHFPIDPNLTFIHTSEFDDHGILHTFTMNPYHGEKKAEGLALLATRMGITLNQVLYFGDNQNDITALNAAGCGVSCFTKKKRVKQAGNIHIPQGRPLTDVLKYV